MTTPDASTTAATSTTRHPQRTITVTLNNITDEEFAVVANHIWDAAHSTARLGAFDFAHATHDGDTALDTRLNQEWYKRSTPRWGK